LITAFRGRSSAELLKSSREFLDACAERICDLLNGEKRRVFKAAFDAAHESSIKFCPRSESLLRQAFFQAQLLDSLAKPFRYVMTHS
jgi:hypothetical protein